jgi:hypothetical protein
VLNAAAWLAVAMLVPGIPPRLSPDVMPIASEVSIIDRVPMEFHRYRSRLSPDAVLALWRGASDSHGPAPRDVAGGWRVASRLQGARQETLQARADRAGGSEVIVARVDLRARPAPLLHPPFALPASSVIRRTIELGDSAGRAFQFVVSLPGAPRRAMVQLCARLLERGWQPVAASGCASPDPLTTQWFLRGTETLGIELQPSGAHTRAVIGHVVPTP